MVINQAGDSLDITLHDEIGFWGTQSGEFVQLLKDNKNVSTINIDINSPGGAVFDGFSIYNNLIEHSATVNVKVSGVAASIASVIAMAGDTVDMPENAMLMIHKPMINFLVNQNAELLRKRAEALDKMEGGIISAYKKRANKTEAELAKMMSETTWFTAKEAKEIGFADTISDEAEIKNYFDFSKLEYTVPETVLNKFDVNHGETSLDIETPEIGESGIDKIINYIKKSFSPKNKEPEVMELSKDVQDAINAAVETATDALNTKVETLEADNKSLKTELESSQAAVTQLTTALNNQESREQNKDYKNFCNSLVNQGRMLPADVDLHVATLAEKHKKDIENFTEENKDTPLYNAYKDFLKALPVVIPVDQRPVANKDGAPVTSMTEGAINAEIDKIMEDKKLDLAAATVEFCKKHPDVDITNQSR